MAEHTPRCRWFLTDPPAQCLGHKPLGLPASAPDLCQKHLDGLSTWIEMRARQRADQLIADVEFRAARSQMRPPALGRVRPVAPELAPTLNWLTSRRPEADNGS